MSLSGGTRLPDNRGADGGVEERQVLMARRRVLPYPERDRGGPTDGKQRIDRKPTLQR